MQSLEAAFLRIMTKWNANYILLKKNQNTEQCDLNIGGNWWWQKQGKDVFVYKFRKTKITTGGKKSEVICSSFLWCWRIMDIFNILTLYFYEYSKLFLWADMNLTTNATFIYLFLVCFCSEHMETHFFGCCVWSASPGQCIPILWWTGLICSA